MELFKNLINQKKLILRYALIGGISSLLNYSIFFFLLNYLNVYYLISSSIGFILSVLFSYYFNRTWTFRSTVEIKSSIILYFLLYTFSLFFGLLVLFYLVEVCRISENISNAVALIISAGINYLASKYLIFRTNRKNVN